jgi:flagellar motor switch protein FliN/FliY
MAQAAAAYAQPPAPQPGNLVDVRPMQYPAFDRPAPAGAQNAPQGGLDLIHDIPLMVSVELGKAKRDISEILEFGMGSVIELEKVAGDPVEVLVNGKLIARGEVVIIDENYGVRITDILNA